MSETIFDKIVSGEVKSWKVWESETHLAFLTPFANTPGQTVVIPKTNLGDDAFELSENDYLELMRVCKVVSELLKKALSVSRVALVVEGTGVAHVHVKLYPLHGKMAKKLDLEHPTHQEFYPEYVGYLSTVEGPKMDDEQLDKLSARIRAVE